MTKALYSLLDEIHSTHKSTASIFAEHMDQLFACEVLMQGEERLVLDQETSSAFALAALRYNTTVKELQLYCDCVGSDEYNLFAAMLYTNKNLETLAFEGFSDNCDIILNIDWSCVSVKDLYLVGSFHNNNGLRQFFRKLASNKTIKKLCIYESGIGDDLVEDLCAIIRNGVLKELDLTINTFTNDGIKAIVEAIKESNVIDFDISHNPFGDEGLCYLSELFSAKLQNLNIGDIALRDQSYEIFAERLSNSRDIETFGDINKIFKAASFAKTLSKLSFIDCDIDCSNISGLATLVATCQLEFLDLGSNKIQGYGMQQLHNAIMDTKRLQNFTISDNPLGIDGITNLAKLISNPYCPLKHLSVDAIVVEKTTMELIATAMSKNTSLLSFSMEYTEFDASLFQYLFAGLHKNQYLQELYVDGPRIDNFPGSEEEPNIYCEYLKLLLANNHSIVKLSCPIITTIEVPLVAAGLQDNFTLEWLGNVNEEYRGSSKTHGPEIEHEDIMLIAKRNKEIKRKRLAESIQASRALLMLDLPLELLHIVQQYLGDYAMIPLHLRSNYCRSLLKSQFIGSLVEQNFNDFLNKI
ncbi:Leucine-rich repeat-containing protein 34 [Terramyces sp. JEL0728]|nr:Leucine-rich repeat-containing protein 34 [Terramyces sp. JEL0728]